MIETYGDTALIEASRGSMCEGCHGGDCGEACSLTGLFGTGRAMRTKANNPEGAKPGDLVEISSSDSTVFSHAFLIFILPLVLTFGAYLVGSSLGGAKVGAIAAGAGFLISAAAVFAVEAAARKRPPSVTIVRIVRTADEKEERKDE